MPQDRLRRRLMQMGAGALGLLGFLAVIGIDPSPLPFLIIALVFGLPGILLVKRSAKYYNNEIDLYEVAGMMAVGALSLLFLSVSVISLDFAVGALAALLFATPAIIIWIIVDRKRTTELQPV